MRIGRFRAWLAIIPLVSIVSSSLGYSAQLSATGPLDPVHQDIPTAPSAPKKIRQGKPIEAFRCDRQFIYDNRTFQCDSFVRRDAEGLRAILQNTPDAIAELDAYQSTRKSVRNLAYFTTIGIVAVVAGLLLSRPPIDGGEVKPGGYLAIAGAGTTAFTFLYSLSLSQTNEKRIGRAVDIFNQANPDHPIVLQFTTNLGF